MEAVSIVTIKNKIPLYKKEEEANSIELIELKENGFELVAQKDLYQIGDKAVYIQPDYCVSDISLFESFIRPNGDESKSMLGKVNGLPRRIRAKKFTLSKEPNGDCVYSNGILLPIKEVFDYLYPDMSGWNMESKLRRLSEIGEEFRKLIRVTKYEEPESNFNSMKVGATRPFPSGVYKTDEENINNLWGELHFPIYLIGTEKLDGSSITIGVTPSYPKGFICSRNLMKPLTITKAVGKRTAKWYEHLMFWKKIDLNIYEEVENDDDFVKYGKPYLNILLKEKAENIIFRGELHGGGLKGSGNKYNPSSKLKIPQINFFGADKINKHGFAQKLSHHDFDTNAYVKYKFPTVKCVFAKIFNSKEELLQECEEYFKNNMIEGIVVRNNISTFSAKIMNNEYDSKK